ncbi:MAG: 2-oxoisovalerate dehydrogenase [Dehalococcoidia bacterium]
MKELIFVVEESPEGGYEAEALGEGIVTEADTLAELRKNVAEAVQAHFDEHELPKVVRLHFVREEVIAV